MTSNEELHALCRRALDASGYLYPLNPQEVAELATALRLLLQPQAVPDGVPGFVLKRVLRELEEAKNPKGMSPHNGKVGLLICDVERILAAVSAAPQPAPDECVLVNRQVIEDVLEYAGNDCRLDHHGLCQEHGLQEANDCFAKHLREALATPPASISEDKP